MSDWKFELGDRVKDRVSGFTGIVVSRTEYLNGCKQYGVNPPIHEGKMVEGYNIDGQQLELVDGGLNETKPVEKRETGGPSRVIKASTL
jgi:hypothetical protein